MGNVRDTARMGMWAIGITIGAAVAAYPAVASADSSPDWWSDLVGGLTLPSASAAVPADFQVSVDGMNLFSTAGNEATATSGMGDIAIAYGDGANASALGGTGDFAVALGAGASAAAGGLSTDTGADGDTAIDIGNNTLTDQDGSAGSYAGNGDLVGGSGTGSNDTAIDIGNNDVVGSGFGGGGFHGGGFGGFNGFNGSDTVGAVAGGGTSTSASGSSDGDTAIDIGNNTGNGEGALSGDGNNDVAIADTNYSTSDQAAFAGSGSSDNATVVGPDNSTATAGGGDSNIAYILDPFGSTASTADAGGDNGSGSYDVAAVLLTDGQASAQNADYLYDLITALGHETGTLPTGLAALLTDWSSLF